MGYAASTPRRRKRATPVLDYVLSTLRQYPDVTRSTLMAVMGTKVKPGTLGEALQALKARGMAEPSGMGRYAKWRAKA